MKSNRVPKNRSAAPSARQVKTPDCAVALFLFDNLKEEEITGVDLSAEEFAMLQERAKQLKCSLTQILSEGVALMLKAEKLTTKLDFCSVKNSSMSGGAQ